MKQQVSVNDYALVNIGPCLRLVGAEHLLPILRQAMPGWALTTCVPQEKVPDICVWQHPEGFWQEAPALPDGMLLDTPVGTACSVIADVAGAYLHKHPELIGLHCGSVEINGQLVIFPDTHRAGKSTLTAAFCAAGYRVFGDDVLAVNSDGEGVALGIAPRLRLPLPEQLSSDFHRFVAAHLGPHDKRYGYLTLNEEQLASHGVQCPVGGILLFDRDEALTSPQLTALQPGEGLWQLLKQNFAEHESDQELIKRFLPMLQRLPCFLLRYSDAYEAALWVGQQWKSKQLPKDVSGHHIAGDTRAGHIGGQALGIDDARQWVASHAAHEFPLGDELFVIAEDGGAIHRFNITGRAVWALLQYEPINLKEICATLLEVFKVANDDDVCRDVAVLLATLLEAGLIQEVQQFVKSTDVKSTDVKSTDA